VRKLNNSMTVYTVLFTPSARIKRSRAVFFSSLNPVIRFPVLMHYGNYKDVVFFDGVEQFVWKLVKLAFPDITALN
nr:hypothetical protein [Anaerohalosphaeraceae bacterium]HRT87531.1 hypothetical protein [Anaerohalosphaeraceae bacterium]